MGLVGRVPADDCSSIGDDRWIQVLGGFPGMAHHAEHDGYYG